MPIMICVESQFSLYGIKFIDPTREPSGGICFYLLFSQTIKKKKVVHTSV